MKSIDLRNEIRFPMTPTLKERFTLKLKLDDGSFVPVELIDVSQHGMRFLTEYNLKEHSVNEFSFIYKDKDENLKEATIISRICWIEREVDAEGFNVGIQIVEVSDRTWMKLILDVVENI